MAKPAAKRIVLDKSRRDYGTVTGTEEHGVAYTQTHKGVLRYFDSEGEEVVAPAGWATSQRPQRVNAKRVYQRVNETDPSDTEPAQKPEVAQEDDVDAQDNSVNLAAWAEGDRAYRFSIVREAIETRFGKHDPTETEALLTLLEMKVTTLEKVAPKYKPLLLAKAD
jgi:hypothetical protein